MGTLTMHDCLLANEWLFANIWTLRVWYALPLVVSISLVYAATRHELIVPILQHAWRIAFWIVGFMLIVFLVLWILEWAVS